MNELERAGLDAYAFFARRDVEPVGSLASLDFVQRRQTRNAVGDSAVNEHAARGGLTKTLIVRVDGLTHLALAPKRKRYGDGNRRTTRDRQAPVRLLSAQLLPDRPAQQYPPTPSQHLADHGQALGGRNVRF